MGFPERLLPAFESLDPVKWVSLLVEYSQRNNTCVVAAWYRFWSTAPRLRIYIRQLSSQIPFKDFPSRIFRAHFPYNYLISCTILYAIKAAITSKMRHRLIATLTFIFLSANDVNHNWMRESLDISRDTASLNLAALRDKCMKSLSLQGIVVIIILYARKAKDYFDERYNINVR